MNALRFAVWNMEWLNDLFTSQPGNILRFKDDDETVRGPRAPWKKSGPTVGERKEAIRRGLSDLDADILVVVEGPNRTEELQLLFDELAEGQWQCFIQPSQYLSSPGPEGRNLGASQCVGVAVRLDRGVLDGRQPLEAMDSMKESSGAIFTASEPFFLDMGEDKVPEWFRYERRPLYCQINLADGQRFRIVGLHLKSKGIFSAYEWSRWWAMADANRERLIAQCKNFRKQFLNVYLQDENTRDIPLIVCGDINDETSA
jgi:hypothetical protein